MYLSAFCKSRYRDYKKPLIQGAVTKTQLRSNKTIILAMKLTAILLLTACLQVSANTYSQTITLRVENAPLDKVVKEIEKQSKFNFFYKEGLFQNATPVTISVSKSTLQLTLDVLFSGQPFEYKIVQNTVFVKRKEPSVIKTASNEAEDGEINGRITNDRGEPLVGANITNKRTGKGTFADANGKFTINHTNKDDVLTITYVGYQAKTLRVGNDTELILVLNEAINELDKVILQAYGQTTRRLNTGNISKVTSAEISTQPVPNILQALQGRVPGLLITQTDGHASSPYKVELRGKNGILDLYSEPLYIVDGIPININSDPTNNSFGSSFLVNGFTGPANGQSPLFSLNPSDIESVEVLKDADATSIYGSRGANGVIIITTKKGKVGQPELKINVDKGISKVTRFWKLLNIEEYVQLRREALNNDGIAVDTSTAPDIFLWDTTRETNWQKLLYGGTGQTTNLQISASGGNAKSKYFMGGGYNKSTDVSTKSGSNQRGTFLLSLNNKITEKFTTNFSANYSFVKINLINLPNGNAVLLPPNAPAIYDSIGKLNWQGWEPLSTLFQFGSLLQPYDSKTYNLTASLLTEYQIVKGLHLKSLFGYNNTRVDQLNLYPIASQNPALNPANYTFFGNNSIKNWIIEPQVEYNAFIGKTKWSALVGGTFQNNVAEGAQLQGAGFANEGLMSNKRAASTITVLSDNYSQYRYSAAFGRINGNYKDKYILTISGRRDASSKFGPEKRIGNFASAAGAWIFSEEKLFRNNSYLSFGKIRASYGTSGNDGISNYKYLTRWQGTNPYQGNSALYPIQPYNPDYHWQTNKKLEVGIDLSFLGSRINATVAWYRNRCNDQLISAPLPAVSGFSSVINNSPASVENAGWEFNLSGKVFESKKISWSISSNLALNRNKLLSYPDLELSPYANLFVIGKPLNITRALHYIGVDPATGEYQFEDKSKDGVISRDFGEQDDRYIKDLNPKFSGGIQNSVRYDNLELGFFLRFVKQNGFNSVGDISNIGSFLNLPKDALNRWQKAGDETNIAKLTTMGGASYSNYLNSDAIFTDASFIRLQNAYISYSIKPRLLKKVLLNSVRIYVQGENIFLITKYKGTDPETQNFGAMPPVKTFVGGIQITF